MCDMWMGRVQHEGGRLLLDYATGATRLRCQVAYPERFYDRYFEWKKETDLGEQFVDRLLNPKKRKRR